jgi:hypothetical protein
MDDASDFDNASGMQGIFKLAQYDSRDGVEVDRPHHTPESVGKLQLGAGETGHVLEQHHIC